MSDDTFVSNRLHSLHGSEAEMKEALDTLLLEGVNRLEGWGPRGTLLAVANSKLTEEQEHQLMSLASELRGETLGTLIATLGIWGGAASAAHLAGRYFDAAARQAADTSESELRGQVLQSLGRLGGVDATTALVLSLIKESSTLAGAAAWLLHELAIGGSFNEFTTQTEESESFTVRVEEACDWRKLANHITPSDRSGVAQAYRLLSEISHRSPFEEAPGKAWEWYSAHVSQNAADEAPRNWQVFSPRVQVDAARQPKAIDIEEAQSRPNVDRIAFAKEIIENGVENAINAVNKELRELLRRSIVATSPTTFVDPGSSSSIRAVRSLVERYLQDAKAGGQHYDKPLSLAVFGPPGSGKSFAVKSIASAIEMRDDKEVLEFNVASFGSANDAYGAFDRIANSAAAKKVPIVLFDEFDSGVKSVGDEGWLKYFVPYMKGKHAGTKSSCRAVLVFVGGSHDKLADFAVRSPSIKSGLSRFHEPWVSNFVSSLSGHVDLVGINPDRSGDDLYLLRRAVAARNVLEQLRQLSPSDRTILDESLVNAMLLAPCYQHGIVSLKAVVSACMEEFSSWRDGMAKCQELGHLAPTTGEPWWMTESRP